MRTFKPIDYLKPGLRPAPSDNRATESLFALETPLRLPPNATSTTWTHLGLLFVASFIGILLFAFVDDSLHRAVLLCGSAAVFVYGVGASPLLMPLVVPLAAALYAQDISLAAFLTPPACLLSFCEHFTRHHIYLQTTEPVSLSDAAQLRNNPRLTRHYLFFAVLVFLAIATAAEPPATRPESYRLLTRAAYYLFPRLAIAYLLLPPYDKVSALFCAFRSWFTYDFHGHAFHHLHVFRSPGGSVGIRLVPVYSLVALLAGGLFSAEVLTSTRASTSRIAEGVVFLIASPFTLIYPVLMLLSTVLLLTAPLLVRASRVAQLARGNDFDSFLERLEPLEANHDQAH